MATLSITFTGVPQHNYKMFIYSILFWQVIFKHCSLQEPKRYMFTFKYKITFNDLFYLIRVYDTFIMYLHVWLSFWLVVRPVTCQYDDPQIFLILPQSRVYTFRFLNFLFCWLFNLKRRFNRPDCGLIVLNLAGLFK